MGGGGVGGGWVGDGWVEGMLLLVSLEGGGIGRSEPAGPATVTAVAAITTLTAVTAVTAVSAALVVAVFEPVSRYQPQVRKTCKKRVESGAGG